MFHGLVTTLGEDSLYCIFVFVQNVYFVILGRLDDITRILRGNGLAKGYVSRELLLRLQPCDEESDFADLEAPLGSFLKCRRFLWWHYQSVPWFVDDLALCL